MAKRKTLVVIDGKSVFYRGYYAMPNLAKPDGTPTGGVYGFAVMAFEILKKFKPDYVCVAWDKPKTNIRARVKMYPAYKANRKPAPPDFYEQIPILHELLEALSWPLYEVDDYEADDILGVLSAQANEDDIDTILVTSDLDVLQLVNHHTKIAALKRGLTNVEVFDEDHFKQVYNMTPAQFIDYKALRGDPSDNIPGVSGVGEKTALELIAKFGSLENLYEHLDELPAAKGKKLADDKDMAFLSRKLVTILLDAPVKLDLKTADVSHVDVSKVRELLRELRFRSLLNQMPPQFEQGNNEAKAKESKEFASLTKRVVSQASELDDLTKAKDLMVFMPIVAEPVIWLSPSDELVYEVPLEEKFTDSLKQIFEDENIGKVGFDLKELIKSLKDIDIELSPVSHDVRIGAFLLNSLLKIKSLSDLVESEVDETDASAVMGALWQLYNKQKAGFEKEEGIAKLAKEIEWPVISVIAQMEYLGIKLDGDYLNKLSKRLEGQIKDIEQEIYKHAKGGFNISSPTQLSDVLFEKMKLPSEGIKKTKTTYSTAASELKKLEGKHPIIELIYIYREWTKLKSTYVDALPKLVDENSKLHTTYALDVAPTGRLSSHDPNLQNIPASEDGLGKEVRAAFVPEKGNVFISADYSQQELRLAAFLSGDKGMLKAFKENADIHTQTIVDIYGKKPEEVTKAERRNAKAINFGILYGQGPHGLAEQTGMSFAEAREFIDKYFKARKGLREYLDKTEEKVKKDGFVETYFGRRRPTPDIHSSNFMVREAAKRAALNMPLQGTAADIMKMAMIKLSAELPETAKLLLQIHDSVIIECPKGEAEKIAKQAKEIMENVVKLDIPLPVDTSIGDNWGEL